MPVEISKGKKSGKSASMTETVTAKNPEGAEETLVDQTTMSDEPVPSGGEPWAQVDVELGGTVPTQQYANIRASVRVSVPCKVEDIDETYETAKEWATDKLSALIEENT